MHPERWLVFDFHDQRAGHHDGAGDHDDEDRGSVTGVDEGIIEPAGLAARPQIEEARIKLALAATRAFAGEPAQRGLRQSGVRIAGHWSFPLSVAREG